MAALLELRVFGGPSLRDVNGVVPPALGWGKPLALLCLLAVRGAVRRDEVVDLLWRDIDEAKARNAFRQALHRLRAVLGEELLPPDRERLRLVRSDRIEIDLDRFEAAVAAGRVGEAIELYRGDFLENATLDEAAFDLWADQERTRQRARFRQVLERGVAEAEASGKWHEAITYARRLVAVAPFEASAARLAAATLVSGGRRLEAQEILRQFGARLQADLGLPMPAELQLLLNRLERQGDAPKAGTSPGPTVATRPPTSLPFVGREAELTQLLFLWRTTADDAGALALIEGEPGIGKSRLARELALHAKSLGRTTVLTGQERATSAQIPFGIFAETLRPLVNAPGIVGASKHLLAEAARLLPELRDALELPPVHDVDDEASRVRFFEGVAALIDAAAYEQPLMIVLEDLQYIAPSSLDLLGYLCARLAGSPVMFTLTLRPNEALIGVASRLRALAEPSNGNTPPHGNRAQRLFLSTLVQADLAAAVTDSARVMGISPEIAARIADRSGGVPGRVGELLRRAAAGEDIAALPVSLRALLSERLQRLSSSQRRLFLVIALLGRPANLRTISSAAHMSESAARESVGVLAADGLVDDENGFITTNELPAQIALDAAGSASRAFLSGWIAESLASDPHAAPGELARFFAQSGQQAPAYDHARRAAFAALAMGALSEAVALFGSARAFAATAEQQAEIEGILVGLGSGKRRLAPPVQDVPTDPQKTAEASAHSSLPEPQHVWERLFPNWRLLLGAAVATLLISTFVLWRTPTAGTSARAPSTDTLVVAEGEPARTFRYVTGDMSKGFTLSPQIDRPRAEPAWLDSLTRPWMNPVASPRGQYVAVARVVAGGSDTYAIGADKRDTIALSIGRGDTRPLGWSPDGKLVLAITTRTLEDGTFDADLFAYSVDRSGHSFAIDSSSRRSVTEAAWAPDGSRIAWVARTGAERQLEIFTSLADGSGFQNLSRHPGDDQHIAWSPDGELLAFASTRDGNSELYAVSVRENRFWRLTREPAQDDFGRFSANGRLIAFESTRGGSAGVYVMPALGGEARRIGAGIPLSIMAWRGGRARYVDRVRVQTRGELDPSDSTAVELLALDQFGEPIPVHGTRLRVLDSALARIVPSRDSSAEQWTIVARRRGLVRVVGDLGRWRFDTTDIRIGREPVVIVDSVADPLLHWIPFGVPQPALASGRGRTIVVNADREWESGVLSRRSAPLLPGLTFTAVLDAPFGTASDAAMGVSIALVAPENTTNVDQSAPQFLRYASFAWSADAGRLVYSVGREVFTEPAAVLSNPAELSVLLRIERDSTVSFTLGGTQRWRSTLRIITPRNESRAQVWLGGRATGTFVRFSGATLIVANPSAGRQPVIGSP